MYANDFKTKGNKISKTRITLQHVYSGLGDKGNRESTVFL